MFILLVSYLLIINIYAYLLYGIDKRRSIAKTYRISERRLLLIAFLGGGIGSWLGMKRYRHKTLHLKFNLLVPFSIIIMVTLLITAIISLRTVWWW